MRFELIWPGIQQGYTIFRLKSVNISCRKHDFSHEFLTSFTEILIRQYLSIMQLL